MLVFVSKDQSSNPPPALLAEFPVIITAPALPSIDNVVPVAIRIPPPEPCVPEAKLFEMIVPAPMTTDPAPSSAKIPPPPTISNGSATRSPCASLPSIVVPVMVITPWLFHSPPPSLEAVFPLTVPPVMLIALDPLTCSPPPFPGAGATPPALLLSNVTLVKFTIPGTLPESVLFASIPPPALFAVLLVIVVPVAVNVPPAFKIPPPEPEGPTVAMLFIICVVASVVTVPPSL